MSFLCLVSNAQQSPHSGQSRQTELAAQMHNETCSLCLCNPETTTHLLTKCNFTEAAWNAVAELYHLPTYNDLSWITNPSDWIRELRKKGNSKVEKLRNVGILLYFWWQIWKERNRTIFEGKEQSFRQVTEPLRADINTYNQTPNRT